MATSHSYWIVVLPWRLHAEVGCGMWGVPGHSHGGHVADVAADVLGGGEIATVVLLGLE